jgi:hypothetical protein
VWWLDVARTKVREAGALVELGEKLAKIAGRDTPWSHSSLSRFADGKSGTTQELASALSIHFGIPSPFYVPRTLPEATAMQAVAALAETQLRVTIGDEAVRRERENLLVGLADKLERGDDGRRPVLQSGDEASRTTRPRGARRVHRGGS